MTATINTVTMKNRDSNAVIRAGARGEVSNCGRCGVLLNQGQLCRKCRLFFQDLMHRGIRTPAVIGGGSSRGRCHSKSMRSVQSPYPCTRKLATEDD
jgi:hypothetical protein